MRGRAGRRQRLRARVSRPGPAGHGVVRRRLCLRSGELQQRGGPVRCVRPAGPHPDLRVRGRLGRDGPGRGGGGPLHARRRQVRHRRRPPGRGPVPGLCRRRARPGRWLVWAGGVRPDDRVGVRGSSRLRRRRRGRCLGLLSRRRGLRGGSGLPGLSVADADVDGHVRRVRDHRPGGGVGSDPGPTGGVPVGVGHGLQRRGWGLDARRRDHQRRGDRLVHDRGAGGPRGRLGVLHGHRPPSGRQGGHL